MRTSLMRAHVARALASSLLVLTPSATVAQAAPGEYRPPEVRTQATARAICIYLAMNPVRACQTS